MIDDSGLPSDADEAKLDEHLIGQAMDQLEKEAQLPDAVTAALEHQEHAEAAAEDLCGVTREMSDGRATCTHDKNHEGDHFDKNTGWGWSNAAKPDRSQLSQEDQAHALLDEVAVPRERNGVVFTLADRLTLFIGRLQNRLYTVAENGMLLMRLCTEVKVLLEGAPNTGDFRTRTAIAKLRAITTPPKPRKLTIEQ